MKLIHKVILLLSLAFCTLSFTGCQTLENIVVLNANQGNNLFLRNTIIKNKSSGFKEIEFDMLVNADHSEILRNPTVNYTLQFASSAYNLGDNSTLYIENEGNRYYVSNADKMYREIDKKKNLNVRYTSEITIEEFNSIISNFSPVSLGVTLSDGSEHILSSKELNEKFNDLRIILK